MRSYNHLKSRRAGPCFFLQERFGGAPGGDKEGPPTSLERGKERRRTGLSEEPGQVLPSTASRLPRTPPFPPTHTHTHTPSLYLLGCRRSPKQQQQQRTRARPSSQAPHRSCLAERAASPAPPPPARRSGPTTGEDRASRQRGKGSAGRGGGETAEAADSTSKRPRERRLQTRRCPVRATGGWGERRERRSPLGSSGVSSATIPARFSEEKTSRRGSIAVTRARSGRGGGGGVGDTRRSRLAAFARRPFPTSASLQAQRAPS